MTAANRAERLERAKGYPYPMPPYSYLFVNGAAHEIVEFGADPVRDGRLRAGGGAAPASEVLGDLGVTGAAGLDERTPVLAYGSNAAPEQLARKYADFGDGVVIPVIKARLAGFDVVYSSHFTRYGSVPATLEASADTVAEIAVTFLTASQLALMHTTEGVGRGGAFGRLSGVGLEVDGLGQLDAAFAYLSRRGSLALNGAPLALSAVAARGRRFVAEPEAGMLALARDRVAPGRDLDAFILETIADEPLRRARSAILHRHAYPPADSTFEVIEVC